MCSPRVRKARNEAGIFLLPETFISSGSQITVILRRAGAPHDVNDVEFIEGAFMFHDGEWKSIAKLNWNEILFYL